MFTLAAEFVDGPLHCCLGMCCQGSIISKEHITHKYIFYFGLGEEASHPEELTIDASMDWVHIACVAGVNGKGKGEFGRARAHGLSLPLPTRTQATQARVHTVGGRVKGMGQDQRRRRRFQRVSGLRHSPVSLCHSALHTRCPSYFRGRRQSVVEELGATSYLL